MIKHVQPATLFAFSWKHTCWQHLVIFLNRFAHIVAQLSFQWQALAVSAGQTIRVPTTVATIRNPGTNVNIDVKQKCVGLPLKTTA